MIWEALKKFAIIIATWIWEILKKLWKGVMILFGKILFWKKKVKEEDKKGEKKEEGEVKKTEEEKS